MDQNSVWWRIVHLEPALWRGVVVAAVALLSSVGVVVAPAVPDTLVLFIVAAAALVQAVWTRPAVTANARVVVRAPDPIDQPAKVEAGEAVTEASNKAILEAAADTPQRLPPPDVPTYRRWPDDKPK
jgi:hypothetical protein